MKNLKIWVRLLIGFSLLLALLIAVSKFSVSQIKSIAGDTTDLYEHPFMVRGALLEAEINIVNMQRLMRELMIPENSEYLEKLKNEIDDYHKKAKDNLKEVRDRILLSKEEKKEKIDPLIKQFENWKPIRDKQIVLMGQKERAKAVEISRTEAKPYVDEMMKELDKNFEFASNKAQEFFKNATDSGDKSQFIVILLTALAVLISLATAFLLTRSITRPVNIAVGIAERLAKGDISFEIPEYSRDEMGKMLESMRNLAKNLAAQMRQLMEGINVIAGSAAEISSATAQFATTTQEVATSVNEVVVSMKEVKQTTVLSNEKAKEMAESARNVVDISRNGEAAVRQTIDVINTIQEQMISIADSVVGLSDQSQSIGEIISAVDDVADQSRLLAVNASIEAVKAGEQGKGFTVVADEIKSLAEQSKQSTSQVRTILTDIQKATSAAVMATEKGSKAVETGVKQANQTGSAIQALGESIDQSSLSAAQIEATSRQQAAGIDQVFSAMESISGAIAQNAESAKQLENSARDLDELGRKLKTIVEKYKI